MFLILGLTVFLVWTIQVEWSRRKLMDRNKSIKRMHLRPLPFVGAAYHFIGSDEDRMEKLKFLGIDAIQQDGVVMGYLGVHLYYIVADPDKAELVLKNCLEKGHTYRIMKLLFKDGLTTSSVKKWRPHRKLINKVFNIQYLHQFVRVFSEHSRQMVEILKTKLDAPIRMWPILTAYTMDSVCDTILGVQFDALKSSGHPFLKAFNDVMQLMAQRMLQPWLHRDFIYKLLPLWKYAQECTKTIYEVIDESIRSKRQAMTSKSIKEETEKNGKEQANYETIIELLLQTHKGENHFTDEEIQEEPLVIALASNDTSASAIGFTLSMLARHPDIQSKVFSELKKIFGDSDRPVDVSDLPEMPYLEAVLKESLRLFPPVPAITRTVDKDVLLPSGEVFYKGTQVMVHIWALHRNPRYWGNDADVFRPDRFLTPLTHNAYMPFSSGPRNCIGYMYAMLSMKTAVATIVRNFEVLPADAATGRTTDDMPTKFLIIMKDVDEYNVRLKSRK